jgi:hypothetical protein
MTNRDNIVKSEDVAPVKKQPVKKVIKKEIIEEKVTTDNEGDSVLIYFESGAGYVTKNGLKFSRENKMAEISAEEANLLLRLPNFRLPSDEEKEVYYNSQED